MTTVISKSRFVSGIQCEKKLFFDIYRKDLKPIITEQQAALFASGHQIGAFAQTVFPGGIDASPKNYYDFSKSILDTKTMIDSGTETIYEAAFSIDGVLAALDILHHTKGERWAIEVKSSTEVKDYHITDASLQYWVMNKSGFKPDKFYLMHINNTYVKQGDIIPAELFTLADITDLVVSNQDWVTENLDQLKTILEAQVEPVTDIGTHCSNPFSCDYTHHCWKHIPDDSVFTLYSSRGKSWKLYEQGVLKLVDIPETIKLSHRQQLQVNGLRNGDSYVDQSKITEFISDWVYPLYFFDFETIFPSIPVLDGTRPFQQVPFQYSLHIIYEPGGEPEHMEFLAQPIDFNDSSAIDPRKQLIEQLKNDIGSKGSVVAYNATFEINVLRDLALAFPEDKKFIDQLINRFVDLLVPFRSGWYYLPAMGNSASIKSVLPAIAPDFSYDDLEISNGGDASNIFHAMIKNQFTGDEVKTREALKKYCEMDTLAMVLLYQELLYASKD